MNLLFNSWILIVVGYFIGSIPIGFLLARLLGIHDIRVHGSGNIGATNVARILGKKYFLLILLLDASKAFFYLRFLQHYMIVQTTLYSSALALLLGNVFSVFLRGRGGKGVSTAIGIILALEPVVALYIFFVWIIIFIFTQTVGIASVGATLFLPFTAWYATPDSYALVLLSFFISVIIIWRHQENIRKYIK